MNSVNLLGRIVANPELRHTQSGTSVTSFTIAVDGGKEKDSNERITDFIDCIAWSNTAELIAKYWEKGRMIAVSGSLKPRSWTDKGGNKRKTVEVKVDSAYFTDSKKSNNTNNNSEEETPY
jgi:single-strand DNA-binding protein